MRVALYARVSTESQQARGTIGSQLAVLRERVTVEGDEAVAEFCDDGHSGARLDRPGLDALRDAAEAGLIAWPSAEPVFDAALLGAPRPPWTPHDDPRLDALAAGFALLLNTGRGAAASTAAFTTTITDGIADTRKELPG